MNGTEFARISGSYSTAFIGTYQVLNQNISNNNTTFRLYGYFYYGGGTHVTSSGYKGFYLNGVLLHNGTYDFSPGYHLLGFTDITVTHNNDGSFPGKYIGISANSWHMNGSTGGNIYANKIERLAIINLFVGNDIEGNFSVNYTSYVSSYTYKLRLSIPNVARLETFDYSSGTTFNFSNETITYLYNYIKNTNSVSIGAVIETWDGNNKIGESKELINVCVINNANPIFNNFVFEDTNPTTTTLTGNNQNIIQGYSNVKATIPVEYIAKPQKGANMIKYSYICGDVQKDIPYSLEETTNNTIEKVKLGVFNVYAIDSRNNSTLVTKNANTTISYNPLLKDNISVLRENGISENTKLFLKGTIDLVNFGMVTNSIKSAKFRYKPTDTSTWSEYKEINVSVDETGNYLFNDNIMGDTDDGFDISNSYNIEVLISDELSSVTFTANLPSGIPNIALHKNGVGIMGKYDVVEGGFFQIGSKNIFKYSTEEVDTGFKWIDGKKIYRKVIDLGILGDSNAETKYILDGTYFSIINISGKIYQSNGKETWANYLASANFFRMLTYEKEENGVLTVIYNRSNASYWSDWNLKITLEYTKTTD